MPPSTTPLRMGGSASMTFSMLGLSATSIAQHDRSSFSAALSSSGNCKTGCLPSAVACGDVWQI